MQIQFLDTPRDGQVAQGRPIRNDVAGQIANDLGRIGGLVGFELLGQLLLLGLLQLPPGGPPPALRKGRTPQPGIL